MILIVAIFIVASFLTFSSSIESSSNILFVISILTISIFYVFNQIVIPVQNLLIFLLAFQRFLLYFYPSSEKYIVPSEKQFKFIIRWLYFISIFGNILYIGFLANCLFNYAYNYAKDSDCQTRWSIISSAIYVILDALVMISSVFYICILISVRKIANMSSSFMKTRTEKAILYQTLVLLFVKLLCFPMLILTFMFIFAYSVTLNTVMNAIYYPLFFIDVLTTPIVFQITYIFCNKTNLEILLKMDFRKAKTWRIVCCGARSNRVEQTELYNMSNITRYAY
ncbi:unnamed protein product [Caenorhabditis angaria]|uniref:G-protein coupled receptors family 1 profile domain-containing protein n=1 Tax=Caenorhabditis angaria TaxID=860376 RepID=A0A9P1N751_9PELO|nr:unnamed protein product [Caenorhabditis angaria]